DRSDLMDQLTRSEEDKQTLTKSLFEAEYEAERLRTIEDKLRSVLRTMAALHTMSLSRRSVGRIIIEAVERSVDPQTKECNIIKFLATLQQSSSEMERLGTESLINLALSADRSDLMDQLTRSEEDKQTLTKSFFEAEYEAERLRTIEETEVCAPNYGCITHY
ncbi:hypothetical protein QYM36_006101, partial [Artemia franciscana]